MLPPRFASFFATAAAIAAVWGVTKIYDFELFC